MNNCVKTQPESVHSTNAKIRRSEIRQYNPQKQNKIRKWDSKSLYKLVKVVSIYDVFLYFCKNNSENSCTKNVTLRLAEGIPQNCSFVLIIGFGISFVIRTEKIRNT